MINIKDKITEWHAIFAGDMNVSVEEFDESYKELELVLFAIDKLTNLGEDKEVKSINQIISNALDDIAVSHKVIVSNINVDQGFSELDGWAIEITGRTISELK